MNFSNAIISVIRNVINFKGRASRSEYNFWMLFLFLIYSLSIQLDPPSNPATNQSTEYHLAKTISVPADTTLVIVSKDTTVYLEENDSIRLTASAASDLEAVCSYEEIS